MVAYYQPPVPPAGFALMPFHGVVRDDHAWIPNEPDNQDWIAYQEWLTAGNTAQPYADMPQSVAPSG